MKIIYLTVIPNQFQNELIQATNKLLGPDISLEAVYEKEPPPHRAHWGEIPGIKILGESGGTKLRQLLDAEKPDLVVFTQYSSKCTSSGLKWCNSTGTPYLLGPHEIIRPRDVLRDLVRYKRYSRVVNSDLCRAVITMGNESTRLISKVYSGPIYNIPYSFDHTHLLEMDPPSTDDGLVFLYSGRLFDFRNPIKSIEVFAKICERNPDKNLKLIMSGEGPLEQQCLDLIEKREIQDRVTWMNDFKDWHDIHRIYNCSHVLLALQHFGTWGIIIQEAMAAGIGVVATSTVQSADNLIVDHYNGYLVPLNDESIVEAMQNYVDDFELFRVHGGRSKEIVKTIDLPRASAKFSKLLKQCLAI